MSAKKFPSFNENMSKPIKLTSIHTLINRDTSAKVEVPPESQPDEDEEEEKIEAEGDEDDDDSKVHSLYFQLFRFIRLNVQ